MNMSFIKRVFDDFLFPFSDLTKKTISINKKIDKLSNPERVEAYNYEYANDDEKIEDKILLDILKETIENKKILEDKAKSTLIAITISSTLIFNIIKFMQDSKNSIIALIVLAFFSFLSLIYMVVAGVLSLYSIGEINKVSIMFPDDYLKDKKDKNVQIAENIEYNYLHNLKRNNYMTVSYKCIITSISFLVLIFIVSTVISFQGHIKKNEIESINSEILVLKNDISSVSRGNYVDKQEIIDIQQNLLNITNDNDKVEKKLNTICMSIEDINNIISRNPDKYSDDIKIILLDLEKKINKLK